MSLPMEVFLCEISENIHSNNCLNIAFKNNFVANDFLFNKLKMNFFMMPRIILEPIFFLFNYKYIYELLGKYFVSNYRHWTKVKRNGIWQEHDIHNVLPETLPKINFTIKERNLGNELLKKLNLNIEDEYVCIHHRTPKYFLENKILSQFDYNLRDLRNENYTKTIDFLHKKNIKIVQMGDTDVDNFKKDERVIYYKDHKLKSSFLDIFLSFGCKYLISGSSGFSNIATMNRKKRIHINFSHVSIIKLADSIYTPFILLKKYKNLKTGEYVPYSIVLEKKLSEVMFISKLNNLGFDIEDNTQEEILGAVKELDYYLEKKEYLYNDENLQQKFNNLLIKYKNVNLKYSKIPYSFLTKNIDLIC